jgi:hypothetical protein
MPPLLDRLRRSLAGSQLTTLESQVTDLQGIAARLAEAYTAGSYELPPTELVRQLREYDSSLISDLVDQMGWEAVSGYGGYSEGERQRAVADSTRMAKYSTLAKWTINLWTFYGLSSNVDIVPDDDSRDVEDEHSAQSVWTEFWDADRNQAIIAKDRLDELSRWLLIKGERFFAFYSSQLDGETTIRSIRPEEITEVYTNPDDGADVWFYKRQWTETGGKMRTLVYPDWALFFSGVDSESSKVAEYWRGTQDSYSSAKGLELASKAKTDVCILFVPFTQLDEDSVRGWPLLAPHGTAWLRAQRDFMQDRAAVTRSVAAFVRRYKVSGGTRAVDSIRSTLQSALQSGSTRESNYPPVAGSSEIMNRAIDAQDLPLQTGAIDAKADSEMFAWFALLAGGIYPHYAGQGDAYRLATASAMEKPMQLQFSLYRNQLGAIFRKIVRIVLQFHERYNKQVQYNTYTASISLDRLVEVDLPVISSALTQINDSIVQPLIESNSLTQEARNTILASMLRLVFQSLGMEDASEIVNETIFTEPKEQVMPEPKEPEATPPEEPEEATQEEAAAPPTEQFTITDEDIENWLAWVEKLDPDLMALVLADEEEMRESDRNLVNIPPIEEVD